MTRAEIRCAHGGLVVLRAVPGNGHEGLASESELRARQWTMTVADRSGAADATMSHADLVRLHEAIGKMLEGE